MPRSIRESLESQPLSGLVLEVGAQWKGSVPHPSPARMMAFSLSGCTRVTASSGESHTFVAGDCLLHEDTSGKGHSTEVISDLPARCVFHRLPNEVIYAAAMSQTGQNRQCSGRAQDFRFAPKTRHQRRRDPMTMPVRWPPES